MTRLRTACENPHVNNHRPPLTRRIGRQPPVDVDFGELFRACARTGTAVEINASPQRLDLPYDHFRAARDACVAFTIDSDAHSVANLGNLPHGGRRAARLAHPGRRDQHLALGRLHAFLAKDR
jgi:DNA polymerase (family 10)